jgi:hypothetical protein
MTRGKLIPRPLIVRHESSPFVGSQRILHADLRDYIGGYECCLEEMEGSQGYPPTQRRLKWGEITLWGEKLTVYLPFRVVVLRGLFALPDLAALDFLLFAAVFLPAPRTSRIVLTRGPPFFFPPPLSLRF